MKNRAVLLLLLAASAWGEVRDGRYHGRDVWTIETAHLRVSFTKSGGHFVEIVLPGSDALSPLWIQKVATMDAEEYVPERHQAMFYGDHLQQVRDYCQLYGIRTRTSAET